LTLVTGNPTVPTNCRAGKSLNLNLKVKPDGRPAGEHRTANVKDGEFRFAVKVSQAQRHDRPELASVNAAE
jgi:hypothetical protein